MLKALTALLAGALLTASAAAAQPSASRMGPAGSPFWDEVPSTVAAGAKPGDIYWVRERDDEPQGGRGWNVVYVSAAPQGGLTYVSGEIYVPVATSTKPQDLLIWAHPTAGSEDTCAPSRRPRIGINGRERTPLLSELLARGYVVAMSDYQGLGTPGATAYGNAEMEAKASLDIARAVSNFGPANVGTRFGVYGWSQGGRAALWSDHLAASYLPEMKLVGAFAMAPAVLRSDIIRAGFSNPHNAGYIIESLAGLSVGHPELRLRDILTSKGLELLATMAAGCHDAWMAASTANEPIGRPEALVDGNPWWTWIKKQDEFLPLSAPVAIYQGDADKDVDVDWTRRVRDMICATGMAIEYRETSGVDHGGIVPIGVAHLIDWFGARFNGMAPSSDCSSP